VTERAGWHYPSERGQGMLPTSAPVSSGKILSSLSECPSHWLGGSCSGFKRNRAGARTVPGWEEESVFAWPAPLGCSAREDEAPQVFPRGGKKEETWAKQPAPGPRSVFQDPPLLALVPGALVVLLAVDHAAVTR